MLQELIARNGLAAHLAILAVAPLFLFPFFDGAAICTVLVWLSAAAALWMVMQPSVFGREHLFDARRRVCRRLAHDPLFWLLIFVTVLALVRALNAGIQLSYDAEFGKWQVSSATVALLPGSTGEAGWPLFGTALALTVLVSACRHALGRNARIAFLVDASVLTGLAAALWLSGMGKAGALMNLNDNTFSFVGCAFGVGLLMSTVSFASERDAAALMKMLPSLGIIGNGAGLFAFSPAYMTISFLALEVILIVYQTAYCRVRLTATTKFGCFIGIVGGFALAALTAVALLPPVVLQARLGAILDLKFFPDLFWETRALLSEMALKSWLAHLWIGSGVATFSLDFRMLASEADWSMLPMGTTGVANGWWWMLAERGVVGLTLFLLPAFFLLFTYVRRLIGSFAVWQMPHPLCLVAFLQTALLAAFAFFDCSPLRVDVLLLAGPMLAMAANAFAKRSK